MNDGRFDFDAGALCLDFANTVAWHASEQPEDSLEGYGDLVRWGRAAGILTAGQAERLAQRAREEAEAAAAAFAAAVRLREAIYRLFASVAEEEQATPGDLHVLNEHLQKALPHRQLAPAAGGGFGWRWQSPPADLEQIVWPVARSAAELLTGERLGRVGQCADDRGCGYLFVDHSRNRSRRWCSMNACGNRAKVHRHYGRQRQR